MVAVAVLWNVFNIIYTDRTSRSERWRDQSRAERLVVTTTAAFEKVADQVRIARELLAPPSTHA